MHDVHIRPAHLDDVEGLDELEKSCFTTDRLSRRSFRRAITSEYNRLIVAVSGDDLLGYVLVFLHRGTSLARMYSIAVAAHAQGRGVGRTLVSAAEDAARNAERIHLRLEVRKDNAAAISLYESMGYKRFGEYQNYYADHQSALRYQKRIHYFDAQFWQRPIPWYQQTSDFTCGPASLLMAMQALDATREPSRAEELRIWREATTIFMTSGHGGCHPLGLALAATRRGFHAEVWISQPGPLFMDSVRNEKKKEVIKLTHDDFLSQANAQGIPIHYREISQNELTNALQRGGIPVILTSTWQLDGKRSPHWLVLSAFDERFLYVHDPDPLTDFHTATDCQYLPIARKDFDRMSRFGRERLRTAVILSAPQS